MEWFCHRGCLMVLKWKVLHTEANTKSPTFYRQQIWLHFPLRKVRISKKISLWQVYYHRSQWQNRLVQVMVCHNTGDKSLTQNILISKYGHGTNKSYCNFFNPMICLISLYLDTSMVVIKMIPLIQSAVKLERLLPESHKIRQFCKKEK